MVLVESIYTIRTLRSDKSEKMQLLEVKARTSLDMAKRSIFQLQRKVMGVLDGGESFRCSLS